MTTPQKKLRKQQQKLLGTVAAAIENLRKLHRSSTEQSLESYCRYMQTWGAAPPLKGIVIGQSPYRRHLIPSISSAFAYQGEQIPPSVDVIATTVEYNSSADYFGVVNGLKHSYCLLDSGYLFADARICSEQGTEEGWKELCYQVACIMQMVILADMQKARRIPVLCFGLEAQRMGAVLKAALFDSRYRLTSASLDVLNCVHPTKISRDRKKGICRHPVVTNVDVVRELGKIPWTVQETEVTWHNAQLSRHLDLLTSPPFNLRKVVRNSKQAMRELLDNPQLRGEEEEICF